MGWDGADKKKMKSSFELEPVRLGSTVDTVGLQVAIFIPDYSTERPDWIG